MKPPNRTLSMIVLAIIVLVIVAAAYTIIAHPSAVRPVQPPTSGSPATQMRSALPAVRS